MSAKQWRTVPSVGGGMAHVFDEFDVSVSLCPVDTANRIVKAVNLHDGLIDLAIAVSADVDAADWEDARSRLVAMARDLLDRAKEQHV